MSSVFRAAERKSCSRCATTVAGCPPSVSVATSSTRRSCPLGSGGMEFSELLARRRMTRSYRDEPVGRAALERIAATVLKAPSGGFSQGHRVVVVTDAETRSRIAELASEQEYVEKGFAPWISQAPAHLVLCVREESYHER